MKEAPPPRYTSGSVVIVIVIVIMMVIVMVMVMVMLMVVVMALALAVAVAMVVVALIGDGGVLALRRLRACGRAVKCCGRVGVFGQ